MKVCLHMLILHHNPSLLHHIPLYCNIKAYRSCCQLMTTSQPLLCAPSLTATGSSLIPSTYSVGKQKFVFFLMFKIIIIIAINCLIRVQGRVVPPAGPRDFGWDPIFQPVGFEMTYVSCDKHVILCLMCNCQYTLV